MPSGNGCRANMQRARNLAKADAAGKATTAEDRKKQEKANNAISCSICLQGFLASVRQPELQQHIESKHAKCGKTVAEVFPKFQASE